VCRGTNLARSRFSGHFQRHVLQFCCPKSRWPPKRLNNMVDNITILNVLKVTPLELSFWISTNVLNDVKLPTPGPNSPLDINNDLMPLLPLLANKSVFITELYIQCMGAKPLATKLADDVMNTTNINAKIDVLYRTIQTLEGCRETAISMKSSMQYRSQHSI
jgi:hypothetical protein